MTESNTIKAGILLDNDFRHDVRVSNEVQFLLRKGVQVDLLSRDSSFDDKGKKLLQQSALGPLSSLQKMAFVSESTLGFYSRFWEKEIRQFIVRYSPSILHAHDLYLLKPAIDASEGKIPVIIDLHENYPAAFRSYSWTKKFPHRLFVNPNYWNRIEKEYLPKAAGIISLSDTFGAALKRRVPRLKDVPIVVYPNVPDLTSLGEIREGVDNASSCFRILYFGMIGKSRGLHVVSQALKLLAKKDIPVEFWAVGKVHKGDQAYFEKQVMGPGVKHIPWIELHQLGNILKDVDACISPIEKNEAHESGIANKVFQYMYFKKPILVSNCIPQEELVKSTGAGLSYTHDDPTALAEAIQYLMDHPEKRIKMGENGHRAVLEKYNTEFFGQQILDLYSLLTKSRTEPR